MTKPCRWAECDDETNCWNTACDGVFQITEGTPADNKMRFCCYCGGALEQVRYVPDDEDEA